MELGRVRQERPSRVLGMRKHDGTAAWLRRVRPHYSRPFRVGAEADAVAATHDEAKHSWVEHMIDGESNTRLEGHVDPRHVPTRRCSLVDKIFAVDRHDIGIAADACEGVRHLELELDEARGARHADIAAKGGKPPIRSHLPAQPQWSRHRRWRAIDEKVAGGTRRGQPGRRDCDHITLLGPLGQKRASRVFFNDVLCSRLVFNAR